MHSTVSFAELLHARDLTVVILCYCTGAWDADAYVAQIMSRLRVDHIHAQPVDRLSGGAYIVYIFHTLDQTTAC
jgi:hypothetical protein